MVFFFIVVTGNVSEAVATQSKASTALGSSEMDDAEGGEGETKVSTLEADTSDILVQDFHHDVDEKEPAFLSSCCVWDPDPMLGEKNQSSVGPVGKCSSPADAYHQHDY